MLPVETALPALLRALDGYDSVVLAGPPGSGKTTVVPLRVARHLEGRVAVLEPRRIAARAAADYLARSHGQQVGYQVRFQKRTHEDNLVVFLTEGILPRQMAGDPELRALKAVILDEFHERHLEGDLALALVRRLQRTRRPDLKLVVMSATLDTERIAAHLDSCPVIQAEGRVYPVEVRFAPRHDGRPLDEQVAGAVKSLGPLQGHCLVFLPGMAEIRKVAATLPGEPRILHGSLPPEEQDRALRPDTPSVILSTNLAESSVTVDGVTAVVDSGLVRLASHSPWSGIPRLQVVRTSQASAEQRAGRAGRTAAGVCLRLYTRSDFLARPAFHPPEIQRQDLSRLVLQLLDLGVTEPLPWLDAPDPEALQAAQGLLERLGATENGRLTPTGKAMARYPLSPRQARLLVECPTREGCRLAALLEEGRCEALDPVDALKRLPPRVEQAARQLERLLNHRSRATDLHRALFRAFPDRLGRLTTQGRLLLSSGGSAALETHSRPGRFLVALECQHRGRDRVVWMASPVEPEWIWEDALDDITEAETLEWDASAGRVRKVHRYLFGELVLDETKSWAEPGPEAGEVMFANLPENAVDLSHLDQLTARLEVVRKAFPEREVELPDRERLLREACAQATSVKEVSRLIHPRVPPDLDQLAPLRVPIPGRSKGAPVLYQPGQAPSLASRLQDFFGLERTPTICKGRVPLVLHLLAPNRRAVQITTDLSGFWERTYPRVRSELRRKYPKHAWPEDPRVSS